MDRFSHLPCDIPAAQSSGVDELFTFLGAALFVAQGLELEVTNLLVGMSAQKETELGPDDIPRLFDEREGQTFGRLLRDVRQHTVVDEDTKALLQFALRERNRLVHDFFREHQVDFNSASGRSEMIEDLREIMRVLREADVAASAIGREVWEALGLSDAMLEEFWQKQLSMAEIRDATA